MCGHLFPVHPGVQVRSVTSEGGPGYGSHVAVSYRRGLHELGDGLFAYLQPNGGWGWSNAGLVTSGGASLLVDTLFDLRLTRQMLETLRPITDASPLQAAVNTHANGDHCFGNELLPPGLTIYGSSTAVEEMRAVPPALVHLLFKTPEGKEPVFAEWARETFAPFTFEGVELRLPSSTFDGRLDLRVGEREVSFIDLGPAHTASDSIVWVPDAGTVFTGDLLFIGGTPIAWQGPIQSWLDACQRILALGAHTLVPGHGPVTDADGVREVMHYLEYVRGEARRRFDAGMDPEAAADDIELGEFAALGDSERLVVNVETAYREFDPAREPAPVPELFARMARWSARHQG
jgi:cyclase